LAVHPQLPFIPDCVLTPPVELRRLRAEGGVHRVRTATGDPAWLVTGHALVRSLLDDPRLGRAHPEPSRAARTGESALFGGPLGDFATEAADHARMRRLLAPHFSPRRLRELRPRIDVIAAAVVEDLAARTPPVDLQAAVAEPFPILVICELLGAPYGDREQFRAWTAAASDVRDSGRSSQGVADLFTYGQDLVRHKRRNPGDDVISRLGATKGVSANEAAMLAMALLFAGHETTVVQIGLGAAHLLAQPRQWQALGRDPELLRNAVEEILRAPATGGNGIPRYARTDIELATGGSGTVTIRAGELLLLDTGAANHDPAVFDNPDSFDIHRPAAEHLTFGHGARYCLGATLARIELDAVFRALTARFPGMRLAVDVDQLELRAGALTGGLTKLPVTW
jgi:cytochrome P450